MPRGPKTAGQSIFVGDLHKRLRSLGTKNPSHGEFAQNSILSAHSSSNTSVKAKPNHKRDTGEKVCIEKSKEGTLREQREIYYSRKGLLGSRRSIARGLEALAPPAAESFPRGRHAAFIHTPAFFLNSFSILISREYAQLARRYILWGQLESVYVHRKNRPECLNILEMSSAAIGWSNWHTCQLGEVL